MDENIFIRKRGGARSITPELLYPEPEPVDLMNDNESVVSIEINHVVENSTFMERNTGYILLMILLIPIVIFIFKKLFCQVCDKN
tara:strand:- start:176 stop:430 length:255 start_codon:yes stop_codon:yes gene_type:complete